MTVLNPAAELIVLYLPGSRARVVPYIEYSTTVSRLLAKHVVAWSAIFPVYHWDAETCNVPPSYGGTPTEWEVCHTSENIS